MTSMYVYHIYAFVFHVCYFNPFIHIYPLFRFLTLMSANTPTPATPTSTGTAAKNRPADTLSPQKPPAKVQRTATRTDVSPTGHGASRILKLKAAPAHARP